MAGVPGHLKGKSFTRIGAWSRDEPEDRIRARLTIPASVTLVPPESIPRSEMETALIRIDPPGRPA